MVITSPHSATTKPAPADSRTSRTGSTKPAGAPNSLGSAEKLYCVLAMQTGRWPKPPACHAASLRAAAGSMATLPAR